MQIREIQASDAARVVEIITAHDEFDGECARRYFDGYLSSPERLSSSREQNFVAVDSESQEVIGTCGFGPDSYSTPDISWLTWFYVDGAYRGRGVGKALLTRTLEGGRQQGAHKVYLDTSSHPSYARSIQVYQRAGFAIEGQLKDYYGKGEDMVVLGLDVSGNSSDPGS